MINLWLYPAHFVKHTSRRKIAFLQEWYSAAAAGDR